jgi:nucleoside phosphorylase
MPLMSKPTLLQIAMEAEAAPVAKALALGSPQPLHQHLPATIRTGGSPSAPLALVTQGHDSRFNVDAIGTQPAALTAWVAATRLSPRLIINAGTAGGFEKHGAAIGDVYLSEGPVVYHHRRIPLGNFEPYGVGSYPTVDVSAIARRLGLKLGKLTTGDSLDMSEQDARQIAASGSSIKDMEGAAVAWVASLMQIPFIAVKSITDLVDAPHPTADQFVTNLDRAVARLAAALPAVFNELDRSSV